MKKLLTYIIGTLLFSQLVSCQNKKFTMSSEQFDWAGTMSCPLGYPTEVYKGGLEGNGTFCSLYLGTHGGVRGWGSEGRNFGHSKQSLPDRLNVTWLSYAENKFYHIDTEIDFEKMLALFKKGFETKDANGKIRHEEYNRIIVGFAPGGVVVIWVSGSGKQVEIGRYQAEKTVIPQSEIAGLDSHDALLFQQSEVDRIMSLATMVPLEVQNANKNKPIPFGLWDTYRKKYQWKPTFVLQNDAKLRETRPVYLAFVNGEFEKIFSEKFPLQVSEKKTNIKEIGFGWKDQKGQSFSGFGRFNEKSALNAFKEIYGDNPENITADVEIKINIPNDFFTVMIKGNGKEVFIKTDSIDIFKTDKK